MFTNQKNGNAAAMHEALEKIYSCAICCNNYNLDIAMDKVIEIAKVSLSEPARNCDTDKDVKKLLEEYIAMRGFTSDNQIRALYELALPVIEWLLEPTEKMKGESR